MRLLPTLALCSAGCLDQTYWPRDPTPVVFANGEWVVCSPPVVEGELLPLRIENAHGADVEIGWVDFECTEVPLDVLADGEALDTDTDDQTVWYARDLASRALLAAFLGTPFAASAPVVIE
jgi:hypothetical protein